MPGSHWDTAVPSAGTAEHIFCNEKGKISSGQVKDVTGLWVCCGEFGRASRRAKERGSATCAHALLPWASDDVRQHQLTVPEALNHQGSWLLFFMAAWVWVKSMHPPRTTLIPKAWVLVQAPFGHSSGSRKKRKFTLCFSLKPKLKRLRPLIFSWCV